MESARERIETHFTKQQASMEQVSHLAAGPACAFVLWPVFLVGSFVGTVHPWPVRP